MTRRTRHPCAGLSMRQREAFEQIAVGNDRCIHSATADALMKRGLVERREETVGRDRFGSITVYRYHVPLPIHAQWCAWCVEQPTDGETGAETGKRGEG